MASKPHPARSTFKHQGRTITVEMINPAVGVDGRIDNKWRAYTYRIPFGRRGAVVDVVGTITHATFAILGWRHPIKIITSATFIGTPIVIQHIEIGHRGDLSITDFADIDIDGLPLIKIKDAAIRAATFTAKLKSRKSNKVGVLTARMPYMRIKELDQPLTDIKIGGRLTDANQIAIGRKYQAENLRLMLPIDDPQSLKQVAKLYNDYYKIGRDALGYISCVKYISQQTNRPANTCQQMITKCREHKLLPKPNKRKRGK